MSRLRSLVVSVVFVVAACAGSDPSSTTTPPSACSLVEAEVVESLIGRAQEESFELPPLSECVWVGEQDTITIRVESVPDATLFVEHAIESTEPDRVSRLDGELDGGVLFVDEAVVVTAGQVVVMVDGLVPTDQLLPVAAAAKLALEASR